MTAVTERAHARDESGTDARGAARAAASAAGKLADAAGPLFSLIVVLRESRDLDALSDVRGTVDRIFADFRSRARDRSVPQSDIEDASYALAAMIDETLLNAGWSGRSAWQSNSLAKLYCNDEFVGLGFFDKLSQIRRIGSEKRDVVEVFYYCLASGFQGKFVDEPARIVDLLDEVSKEIATSDKVLAPRGLPPKEGGRLEPIRRFPWPIVAITFVLLPLLVWLITWNLLNGQAQRIVKALSGAA